MGRRQLKVFGQTVRFFRNALSITQEELAARCEFHRTYIGQVERGERNPALMNVTTICEKLEVPLTIFFSRYQQSLDATETQI
jgi:transcriptional regulator with XRE-family HTH domain